MKRRLQIALVTLLIAGLFIPALLIRPALADDAWYINYDFTASDQGWVADTARWGNVNAYYSAGTGWTYATHPGYINAIYHEVGVRLSWPASAHVTRVDVHAVLDHTQDWVCFNSTSSPCQHPATTGSVTVSLNGLSITTASLYLYLTDCGSGTYSCTDHTVGDVELTSVEFWGDGSSPVPTETPTYTPTFTPTPTLTPTPTATSYVPPTVPASGACQSSWTKTWDFRQGDGGWVNRSGRWNEGVRDDSGYHTVAYPNDDSGYSQHLIIQRQIGRAGLETETVVSSISLDVDYNQGGAGTEDLRQIRILVTPSTILVDAGSPPPAGQQTVTAPYGSNGGNYQINVYASGRVASQSQADGSATVMSITMAGTGYDPDGLCTSTVSTPGAGEGSWAYPVAQGEQYTLPNNDKIFHLKEQLSGPEGLLAENLIYTVPFHNFDNPDGTYDYETITTAFITQTTGAHIHSMFDGTVDSVVPYSSSDNSCTQNVNIASQNLLHPPPAYSCISMIASGLAAKAYAFSNYGASVVTVSNGDTRAIYIVSGARVAAGQAVTKGCILGTALAIYVFGTSWDISLNGAVGGIGGYAQLPVGYTIVQATNYSNEPFDLIPYLLEQPQDITCSSTGPGSGAGGGCTYVRDASFSLYGDDANAWYVAGGEETGDAPEHPAGQGMGLWLKATATQPLVILPGKSYSITVQAHLLEAGRDSFTVTLGTGTAHGFTLTSVTPETFTAGAETIALKDNAMMLSIAPDDTRQNIVLDYVCVMDGDSGPVAPAGNCLVLNPEFDTQDGWTLGGSAAYSSDTPGVVFMPNGATVSQSLYLAKASGGAQGYTITVEASAGHAPAAGQSFSLAWAYGSVDSGTLGPFTDNLLHSTVDTFSVSTSASATLTLTGTVTGTTTAGYLGRVCITTTDGVSPPGYQVPEAPGISPVCKVCTYVPVGDVDYDLAGVIGWLMCGISQIWHCQMKTILYGIWQVATNILTFLSLWRLWMAYTLASLATWSNANANVVARWANGQFTNLGQMLFSGPRSVITTDTGSNLWDALRSFFGLISTAITSLTTTLTTFLNDLKEVLLGLMNSIVTLALSLFQIVGSIVSLIIGGIFSIATQLIDLIRNLLSILISAFNAPPVSVQGIPICDLQADMIPQSCIPLFMIENTVFPDDSPLVTVLPWIEGVTGFACLWWAIHRVRNALLE